MSDSKSNIPKYKAEAIENFGRAVKNLGEAVDTSLALMVETMTDEGKDINIRIGIAKDLMDRVFPKKMDIATEGINTIPISETFKLIADEMEKNI